MKQIKTTSIFILLLLSLSGCVTTTPPVSRTATFDSPRPVIVHANYEIVWAGLVSALQNNDYFTNSVSKDAGLIVTEEREMDGLFPFWIFADTVIPYQSYSEDSTVISYLANRPRLLSDYLTSESCVHNGYGTVVRQSINNNNLADADIKGYWQEFKNFVPSVYYGGDVKARASIRVIKMGKNKTSLVFNVKARVPFFCSSPRSGTSWTHILFTGGSDRLCSKGYCPGSPFYSNKFKVPHNNPITNTVVAGIKEICNCTIE